MVLGLPFSVQRSGILRAAFEAGIRCGPGSASSRFAANFLPVAAEERRQGNGVAEFLFRLATLMK